MSIIGPRFQICFYLLSSSPPYSSTPAVSSAISNYANTPLLTMMFPLLSFVLAFPCEQNLLSYHFWTALSFGLVPILKISSSQNHSQTIYCKYPFTPLYIFFMSYNSNMRMFYFLLCVFSFFYGYPHQIYEDRDCFHFVNV